jgi:outer membrane protein insertion porin family
MLTSSCLEASDSDLGAISLAFKSPFGKSHFLISLLLLFAGVVSPALGSAAEPSLTFAGGQVVSLDFFVNGLPETVDDALIKGVNALPKDIAAHWLVKELVRSGKYKDVIITESIRGNAFRWRVDMQIQRSIFSISIDGIGFLDESMYVSGLRSKAGSLFLEQYVEEDIARLTEMVREKGYPNAEVTSVQVRGVPNGTVRVDFKVERGDVCRVAEVKISGTQNVIETISLPIELGAICDTPLIRKKFRNEQERLISEGFLQASVKLDRVVYSESKTRAILFVSAVRGPKTIIETIDLATGEVTDDLLGDQTGLSAFDLTLLSDDDLKREIQNLYLEKGFAQVKVTGPNHVDLNSGDKMLRFLVLKGPQISIGEVEFTGDGLPVTKSQALESMDLNPGIFSQSIPYVERELPRYRESLEQLLLNEGFGDVAVDFPRVSISRSGGTAKLSFNIRLSRQYVLSELTILGRPDGMTLDRRQLTDTLDLDEPVSGVSINALQENIRRQLIEAGYYYAQVRHEVIVRSENDQNRKVLLVIEIMAGPLVRIGNVYTEGELYDKGERVRSISGLEKGAIFAPGALERARLRILRHSLFGSVSVEAFDQTAVERRESELDVVIRATGRRGYSLTLSPAYGTRNGYRFGTEFVWNEINDSGARFNVATQFSQDRQQVPIGKTSQEVGRKVTFGLTEPLLRVGNWVSPFDARVVFGLEVSNQDIETRLSETYQIALTYRPTLLGFDFDFEGGFGHEWSNLLSSRIEPLEAINNPSLQIHELFSRIGFDTRDNVEWARRGMLHELETQHARFGLDSDVAYDRYHLSSSFFIPLLARWSHAVSVGYITISDVVNRKKSTVTAPASRRSGLNGRGIVRGFPESGRSLGPLVWLDIEPPPGREDPSCINAVRAIGATNVLYAKYELRYRTSYFSDMLGLAWFVDSGAAYFTDRELTEIRGKIRENVASSSPDADECQVTNARVYQPPAVRLTSGNPFTSYWRAAFVSSGIGVRFIVPNFASISFDWGLPLIDPATSSSGSCSTVAEAESSGQEPVCIKRDRQDRLFGAIPIPGSFHIGIGATL